MRIHLKRSSAAAALLLALVACSTAAPSETAASSAVPTAASASAAPQALDQETRERLTVQLRAETCTEPALEVASSPNTALDSTGVSLDPAIFTAAERGRNNITAGPLAKSADGQLTLQAMGVPPASKADTSRESGIWFLGRGFTAGSPYVVAACYPPDSKQQGSAYTFISSSQANPDGSTPQIWWNPFLTNTGEYDPRGIYRIAVLDVGSGKKVTAQFVINYS